MTMFLRVVFACSGVLLGLIAGSAIGFGAGYQGLFDPPNPQSDAVTLIAIAGGAVCGLAAGIIIPLIIEAKKYRNEAAYMPQSAREDVWPPPPST